MAGRSVDRPPSVTSGHHGGTEPHRCLRCPRPDASRAGRRLFHAAVHREDIDQAGGFQNPAHRRLRGSQRQVAGVSPGPFPDPKQHRQAAVADALQARQVDDDRGPADRHGRDEMGRDRRGVGWVKLPAQGDDGQAVAVTDVEIHVKHGPPS